MPEDGNGVVVGVSYQDVGGVLGGVDEYDDLIDSYDDYYGNQNYYG